MIIKSDKIVSGKELFSGYIYIKDGIIVNISNEKPCDDIIYDFTGKYVSPGFIDTHTHGGGTSDFLTSSADEVANGCNFHLSHGTTTIAPTVSAAPFDTMKRAVKAISEAKKSTKTASNILGAHLEGPYLSPVQCGAQTPDFITAPIENEYKRLIEDFGEDILRWTYAPECDKGCKFVKFLNTNGITASAGHTNAVYADMEKAIKNGCNLITHLYSCVSTITRNHGYRALGVIETAYLEDDMFVEIIADGKHLPPELIQMILKIKGPEKIIAVTDSLKIAGTDIKSGTMSGTDFIVEDGVCKLKDRSAFAGSVATADMLLKTLVNLCGYDIPTAVYMMTKTSATLYGLNKGIIEKGRDADIVVFNDTFEVSDVFVGGNKIIL